MVEPFALQAMNRRAVDLLWKALASRPAEFCFVSEDIELLRLIVNDDRFRDLAALKIHERNNP